MGSESYSNARTHRPRCSVSHLRNVSPSLPAFPPVCRWAVWGSPARIPKPPSAHCAAPSFLSRPSQSVVVAWPPFGHTVYADFGPALYFTSLTFQSFDSPSFPSQAGGGFPSRLCVWQPPLSCHLWGHPAGPCCHTAEDRLSGAWNGRRLDGVRGGVPLHLELAMRWGGFRVFDCKSTKAPIFYPDLSDWLVSFLRDIRLWQAMRRPLLGDHSRPGGSPVPVPLRGSPHYTW